MWWDDKQPFVFAMGDGTGYGFHGDFVSFVFSSLFILPW
jgi:hypothetical protein